ncbi:adenylosuccinate synthetase [Rhizobium leguminosarum]|uniref:Adenylosuccinate synthetase n=2 Tax=Rhizobium TaxID=379 RepID=A0A179C0H6_RHILE|nr:adenylosuccinate synthetase [Rhizobium leguminosarum]ANP89915.1 adenylosuccinate synthetase [Rhizobium leguminosarum]OAP97584.1 adenylosuccinate synthetase [Rhizobium leguminosarum]
MTCSIVVGGQWGDEAKGKICSYLAVADKISVACRAGLGPGAGHTVVYEGRDYKLRQSPSAFINPNTRLFLGAGVLINSDILIEEITRLGIEKRVGIDPRATLVEPHHRAAEVRDANLTKTIGSTGSGHGPSLADRAMRRARRSADEPQLQDFLVDVSKETNACLDRGEHVLIEGTNGYLLSVLYGTYPYAVGKDSCASTAAADIGIGPTRVDHVIVTFKAFPTRVGAGPFPTEMSADEAKRRGFIQCGTVTGRPRRVGEFDFELAADAARVNGATQLAVTHLDWLDPGCNHLPMDRWNSDLRRFVDRLEQACNVPATLLGTGPDTHHIVDRRHTL